jgi:pantetheine-phosphate adenylyltransferase
MHEGHKQLLRTASNCTGYLVVGLTTDHYLDQCSGKELRELIPGYGERHERLKAYIETIRRPGDSFRILPVEGPVDDCSSCRFGQYTRAIFTGEEPAKVSAINTRRRASGLYEVRIEIVPRTLTQDGQRISSTRIRRGEITPEGKLL